MIDLRPDHLEIVRDLLRQYVPGCEVRAFGSRFKWIAKQASDLDLAVVGTKRLPVKMIARLKEAFAESILPMRVDVLDWHAITSEFQQVIEEGFEVIQGGEVSPLAPASSPSAAGSSATPLCEEILGPIPSDWEYVQLGEVCRRNGGEIQTGPFGSQLHAADYVLEGIPSIMPQNIGDNRIDTDGIARITNTDAKRLSRYLVRSGDIVYSRRGDVEKRALIRQNEDGWLCGTGCLRIRFGNKKSVIPEYASFYLGHPSVRSWIVRHAQGATMPNLNTSILSSCPFVLPPENIQRALVSILGTLDDRIELCRRTNETLESMARALFKDWFIDFGPVRTKMEGRESSIPNDILNLFPDRLIESERGEIPEGWSYGSILTLARLLSGGTPKTTEPSFWDGNIQWASAKDVSQCGETFLLETERRITNLGLEKSSTKMIPAYCTVIVARGATTGRLTMFGEEMAMNQTCYGLHSKLNAPFALYCHTRDFIDSMVSAAHGSVFDTITTQTFEATPVLLPSEKTLMVFDQRTSEIFSKILSNLNQMRTLAEIRDSLLPRLLSGELSVNQIQGLDGA